MEEKILSLLDDLTIKKLLREHADAKKSTKVKTININKTRIQVEKSGFKFCMSSVDIRRFLSESLIRNVNMYSNYRLKSLAIEVLETCIEVDPSHKVIYRQKETRIINEDERGKLLDLVINLAM